MRKKRKIENHFQNYLKDTETQLPSKVIELIFINNRIYALSELIYIQYLLSLRILIFSDVSSA